jgi:hypothetical protein
MPSTGGYPKGKTSMYIKIEAVIRVSSMAELLGNPRGEKCIIKFLAISG